MWMPSTTYQIHAKPPEPQLEIYKVLIYYSDITIYCITSNEDFSRMVSSSYSEFWINSIKLIQITQFNYSILLL